MSTGKASLPQMLPFSASIHLDQLPDDPQALDGICALLEKHELLNNAVGFSPVKLHLTAHLGSQEAKDDLVKLGFSIVKQHTLIFHLTRHHDTTPLSAKTLSKNILHLKQNGDRASFAYDAHSDMDGLGNILPRGKFVQNLMQLVVPGHSRALTLVLDMKPAVTKLSFDDIVLGSFARTRHVHQKSLDYYLRQEITLWADAVHELFPDLLSAFTTWSNGYIPYLRELVTSSNVVDSVIDKIADALQLPSDPPKKEVAKDVTDAINHTPVAPTPAVDMPEAPDNLSAAAASITGETLKDKLRTIMPTEEGPLTAKPAAIAMTELLRIKPHHVFPAWQIPDLSQTSVMKTMEIPVWVLHVADQWNIVTDSGIWLVKMPFGVQKFTPEQLAFHFTSATS